MKHSFFILIYLIATSTVSAQEKNFRTTVGLSVGPSIAIGSFASHVIADQNSGYASNAYDGFKFTLEQNLGKQFGISANFYSIYYTFDLKNFEKSLLIDNRGIAPDHNLSYELLGLLNEWNVGVGNIGFYYYKYLGRKKRMLLNFIAAATITEMDSPAFVVTIKDASNNLIERRTIGSAQSWTEVFFLPPFDGFSFETNARYFFSKHFAVNSSLYFVNSKGYFDGNAKALLNLSTVNYSAFNFTLGITYTIFYKEVHNSAP